MISIGLPIFNAASSVLDTVRSVLAQSYNDWELIILDDGSTDGSLDLVSRIQEPRIRIVADRENRGLAQRLNELTQLARGEYIARIDGDDLMHPERLATQVALLEARQDVDVVAADGISIDTQNTVRGYRESIRNATVRQHFTYGPYLHSVVTGRTAWFMANPYDPALRRAEDQELWIRTLPKSRFEVIKSPLLYVREEGNVSADKYARSIDATRAVINRHADQFLSWREKRVLLLTADLKKVAYRGADRLNHVDLIVRRRSASLSHQEVEMHHAVLSEILSTPIPGVDA